MFILISCYKIKYLIVRCNELIADVNLIDKLNYQGLSFNYLQIKSWDFHIILTIFTISTYGIIWILQNLKKKRCSKIILKIYDILHRITVGMIDDYTTYKDLPYEY